LWIAPPPGVATGGVWDSFVLLPRILGCWGSFARAFLPGRLDLFLWVVGGGSTGTLGAGSIK
jgi:hypothetical protein